jgi:hypothetical protein
MVICQLVDPPSAHGGNGSHSAHQLQPGDIAAQHGDRETHRLAHGKANGKVLPY